MNHLRTARRSTSWWVRPILLTLILFAAIVTSVSPHFNRPVAALSPDIVISQVYGGGGAAVGSTYTNDFVELFNRGATAVDVTGWSIQYASAAGTGLFGATTVVITPLSGTLQPGQYLLVEGAVSTATPTGVPLPTPDVTDTSPINLSGSSGKVALVTDSTPLGCNGGSTPCDAGMLARIQDLVGYGATATTPPNFFEGTVPAPEPAPSASNGVQRKDGGCTETDDNGADFLEAIPAPRNMASTFNPCYPDTSIDSNPTDPSNSANASFTFSSADAGSMFECQLDGGGWATCTSPQNYAGLADSSHTFEVKATNMRGNTDPTPASWTWLIDTMPPDTSIDSNPPDPSNSANASFTFSANEAGSSFECQLDGGGWSGCTSPQNYAGLADGSHTFEVRATDAAANTDPTPASYTWLVDIVAPPTPILVSTLSAGSVGSLNFGLEDILMWDGSNWSTWFDGSAAGLMPNGKAIHNINAFAIPDPNDDDVIMAFAQNKRHVPGIALPVEGMDLVRWNGTAFSFYFDGSDVGLTSKTQEKIDALHILPGSASPINGGSCLAYLLISTPGPGKVNNPGGGALRFSGEDVLGFCMTSSGDNTAGLWHLVLDGSAEGMPPNSLVNLSASDDGQVLYLTTRGAFNVDAASGGHSMVYRFDRGTGLFSGPFFSAPAAGLAPGLDGLQVMGDLP